MTNHYHAVAWIDHRQARVVYFNADHADEATMHAPHEPHHIHSTKGSAAGTHLTDELDYCRDIAKALAAAQEFYIVGPASAKTEFVEYLRRHAPQALSRMLGVETMDKVSDNELVAAARRLAKAADRMRPQLERH